MPILVVASVIRRSETTALTNGVADGVTEGVILTTGLTMGATGVAETTGTRLGATDFVADGDGETFCTEGTVPNVIGPVARVRRSTGSVIDWYALNEESSAYRIDSTTRIFSPEVPFELSSIPVTPNERLVPAGTTYACTESPACDFDADSINFIETDAPLTEERLRKLPGSIERL